MNWEGGYVESTRKQVIHCAIEVPNSVIFLN
jgi:hypothetical protein